MGKENSRARFISIQSLWHDLKCFPVCDCRCLCSYQWSPRNQTLPYISPLVCHATSPTGLDLTWWLTPLLQVGCHSDRLPAFIFPTNRSLGSRRSPGRWLARRHLSCCFSGLEQWQCGATVEHEFVKRLWAGCKKWSDVARLAWRWVIRFVKNLVYMSKSSG